MFTVPLDLATVKCWLNSLHENCLPSLIPFLNYSIWSFIAQVMALLPYVTPLFAWPVHFTVPVTGIGPDNLGD